MEALEPSFVLCRNLQQVDRLKMVEMLWYIYNGTG